MPIVVGCLNPHSFVVAEEDEKFKSALQSCNILLPDGDGICMMVRRWKGKAIRKIAGTDFHYKVLGELEANQGSIFYMGSSNDVLEKVESRIHDEYPHIRVRTYSPPYKSQLSSEDNQVILQEIDRFAPDALMVGMTAPKQEKWIAENLAQLQGIKVIGAIGGVFDFFAGTVNRGPQWILNLKLEWLWRFVQEPRRLWQRNMVSTPKFLAYCRRYHKEM